MDESGEWTLAPAHDLTLATYPLASGFRAARVMGKAGAITRDDLRRLGNDQAVRHVDDSINQVLEAVAGWSQHAENHGLPKSVIAMVGQQHGLAT